MEASSKVSSAPSGTGNVISSSSSSGGTSTSTVDNNDVYEFKSSKEATPVRGSSTSPNPEKEKDSKSSGNQSQSGNTGGTGGTSSNSSGEASTTSGVDDAIISTSPSSKRPFEGDNTEEQDEENRKKKRKDIENLKDNPKGNASGRQNIGRNNANAGEKVFLNSVFSRIFSNSVENFLLSYFILHFKNCPISVYKIRKARNRSSFG